MNSQKNVRHTIAFAMIISPLHCSVARTEIFARIVDEELLMIAAGNCAASSCNSLALQIAEAGGISVCFWWALSIHE